MNWQQLLALLQQRVGQGQVTTYRSCSNWAFGHRKAGQAVRSMLEAAARRGNQTWTNRVVSDDGALRMGAQVHGQLAQLKKEGVPFHGATQVNFVQCPPVP